MAKKKDKFNPAFKDLDKKIKQTILHPDDGEDEEADTVQRLEDDDQPFYEAMSDVTPLPEKGKMRIQRFGPNIRPPHSAPDDEREVMNHLHSLVKGAVDLDINFSDEYMEGAVKGFSQKMMKKLKRGDFAIQDFIDLHGLTKPEAEAQVNHFIVESQKRGYRCVLIVHGRGLNSPDSFPVLKEGLPRWLSRGPAKKIVLAFATARPYDGGTGAIYVILRKS